MDSSRGVCLWALLFLGVVELAAASSFISDGALQWHGSTGRSLLQAKTSCPINFEFLDYSVITNQCKGPDYPPKSCCAALVQFACPYAAQINDVTNDCASIMFSYINLYGKYPPGLFASECTGDKQGLACPDSPSKSQNTTSSSAHINRSTASLTVLVSGIALSILFF